MKELLELRINGDYANLLFGVDEGRNLGSSVKIIMISKDDPRYYQIPLIAEQVKVKYNRGFFFGWEFKRKYTKVEIATAQLLYMKIKTTFEPAGEECGTLYDETTACKICGANRKQISLLTLKHGSIPKKDIARTIAGEVVVSEKFVKAYEKRYLKGASFEPISLDKRSSNYYQLVSSSPELELTNSTIVGVDPFDLSENSEVAEFIVPDGYHVKFEKEIYKCPKGHTIGLNLLSEPYVLNSTFINNYDFFASKQKIGVKRGFLRPEPLLFCSPAFKKMVEDEKLIGFDFEIAHVSG